MNSFFRYCETEDCAQPFHYVRIEYKEEISQQVTALSEDMKERMKKQCCTVERPRDVEREGILRVPE